ncbi:Sb-PDE family phosphodiesterase [Fodinibius sediminis]|uniref:Polymerase/histidinol phosphatase N-terminal domain-containing protein n=1 Tax=Fodinibius sediminis TaxID=1214077 RepID=A0A521CGQ8_9BACT|nr:Sb-PDE family phosphodiesterase [Fodinibius sediminis]SMO58647.1 hypothetical protein SAMN06265218_10671 [Fodinibius sediminis]
MFQKISTLVFIGLFSIAAAVQAQHEHPHDHQHPIREVTFPDIPGYQTLSTDLHIHTVFSDGSVWPDIRVQEAMKDNLDAIAMTDHLEYQPHSDDIPHPDRNRSYEIASEQADEDELIVINGSEITRSMPPGHSNAVFVEDANKLLVDDAKAAFREAKKQGAFTFWNHPYWLRQASDGMPPLSELHKTLIEGDMLHGIEVVNMDRYSREALQIALDYDLTIMGTSDVHGLIDWDYQTQHDDHRPVTLVFAKERTKEGLREALFAGRTVVWKDDLLIGREEYLVPLVESSLTVENSSYIDETSVLQLTIRNSTGQKYQLENLSDYSFHRNAGHVTVEPFDSLSLQIRTGKRLDQIQLPFKVYNAVTAPETNPEIMLEASIDE